MSVDGAAAASILRRDGVHLFGNGVTSVKSGTFGRSLRHRRIVFMEPCLWAVVRQSERTFHVRYDRCRDGEDGLLRPTLRSDAMELRMEVGAFGSRRRPGA